ncbi:glutamate--cysteine ligase ['Osedax' symbiont bacterium Rs2_46_30_T18]|nr:glutamate--cysteine ligase ['Osedax' symbiont bacterium Rs2_46_30_T18]
MQSVLESKLEKLSAAGQQHLLTEVMHGIEKEGLRVTPKGRLSQSDHPNGLGSALTNGVITTDYSESLLEFITPVYKNSLDAINYLTDLHRFTYRQLDEEIIWNASMPCYLKGPDDIRIGEYGNSNSGRMKHIYRVGLASRYGKMMQSIAGIHYNFSLSDDLWQVLQSIDGSQQSLQDYRSDGYFSLIRNFRRQSWLLLYLFGSSPALSDSFMGDTEHQLQTMNGHTLYLPHATSLRMSDFGYSNKAQESLDICFNYLDSYANSLRSAIKTPFPAYQEMGVKVNGSYRQLNANVLQIENEYYSDIRPKRVAAPGEKPVDALIDRGVEYIEVRNTDINPLLPVGIDNCQAQFMDAFLLTCLLQENREICPDECDRISHNNNLVVNKGREPGLKLSIAEGEQSLTEFASQILDQVQKVAVAIDSVKGGTNYSDSVKQQRAKVADSDLTPSAIILASLRESGLQFTDWALHVSRQHREDLLSSDLDEKVNADLSDKVSQSILAQQEMEQSDSIEFEQFLEEYMSA